MKESPCECVHSYFCTWQDPPYGTQNPCWSKSWAEHRGNIQPPGKKHRVSYIEHFTLLLTMYASTLTSPWRLESFLPSLTCKELINIHTSMLYRLAKKKRQVSKGRGRPSERLVQKQMLGSGWLPLLKEETLSNGCHDKMLNLPLLSERGKSSLGDHQLHKQSGTLGNHLFWSKPSEMEWHETEIKYKHSLSRGHPRQMLHHIQCHHTQDLSMVLLDVRAVER